jgi:hypothetical protein
MELYFACDELELSDPLPLQKLNWRKLYTTKKRLKTMEEVCLQLQKRADRNTLTGTLFCNKLKLAI